MSYSFYVGIPIKTVNCEEESRLLSTYLKDLDKRYIDREVLKARLNYALRDKIEKCEPKCKNCEEYQKLLAEILLELAFTKGE